MVGYEELKSTSGGKFAWPAFSVKDSGVRSTYQSGMVRDTDAGKIWYDLVFDGPMLVRWADHLSKGAKKYEKRNWMKADGEEEQERFRSSAIRHFVQWVNGENDEDHAAATFFNINAYEYVTWKLKCAQGVSGDPPTSEIAAVGVTLADTHVD